MGTEEREREGGRERKKERMHIVEIIKRDCQSDRHLIYAEIAGLE